MVFCLIPPGSGWMGSEPSETGHYEDEAPRQPVEVTRPFFLGRDPVTTQQWNAIWPENVRRGLDACPITEVDWDDVQEWIRRLNLKEKRADIRLPRESEWEFACRAGSTGPFADGIQARDVVAAGVYPEEIPTGISSLPEGAGRPANAWGLRDMHGWVWEWCLDGYAPYTGELVRLPSPPFPGGSNKVCRGGSWRSKGFGCRSASRGCLLRGRKKDSLGFRLLVEGTEGLETTR